MHLKEVLPSQKTKRSDFIDTWQCVLFLCSCALLCTLLTWVAWKTFLLKAESKLPQPLFDRPHALLLLDQGGELLEARVAEDGQWRFPEPSDLTLPVRYEQALLHYEDQRFYQHTGVDPIALLRASWQNFVQGRIVSGASTISMQVIRLALRHSKRTLSTKLYESWLALGLEHKYSKKEILAFYRAHAPFGGNVVGLDAASWRYFGRAPQDLTWAEGATLAVLPNQPGLVHLKRNRPRLKAKRDALLHTLHQRGVLTQLDLTLSLAEPLPTLRTQLPQLAPHFLDQTLVQLKRQAQQDDEEARTTLASGRIQSSIDHRLQQRLSHVLKRHGIELNRQGIDNAAILVIDHRTLQPVVYLGNLPERSAPSAAYLDLIPRPRSTGSTLKPILFASALDTGLISPRSLLNDTPTHFEGFRPLNADRKYRGAVRAERALIRSFNIPFVHLILTYGVARFQTVLQGLGLQSLRRAPQEYGATLIIGGAEASLHELTLMYALLAHKLLYPSQEESETVGQQRVNTWDDRHTQTRYQSLLKTLPLSLGAIWLTFETLTELARPSEYAQWRQLKGSQRVAWKTGTSQGFRDAWAIGVTPRYTIGVWVGNASGVGRPELTGSQAAAPLLFESLRHLDGGGWFQRPDSELREATICRDSGYLMVPGCETESIWLPRHATPLLQDHYHQRLHLDQSGRFQVSSACYPVSEIRHQSRLILPPHMAIYYQRQHNSYQGLPPIHPQCTALLSEQERQGISFIYPKENAKIYLPRELDGTRGEVVFKVALTPSERSLYWHLDEHFVGHTKRIHELSISPTLGQHKLTVISEDGARLVRAFEILNP